MLLEKALNLNYKLLETFSSHTEYWTTFAAFFWPLLILKPFTGSKLFLRPSSDLYFFFSNISPPLPLLSQPNYRLFYILNGNSYMHINLLSAAP